MAGKQDYKKVPQIKIKNEELKRRGFDIGKEFAVIYQPGKITLVLVEREGENNKIIIPMSKQLTNNINQSQKIGMYLQKVGTQSVLDQWDFRKAPK